MVWKVQIQNISNFLLISFYFLTHIQFFILGLKLIQKKLGSKQNKAYNDKTRMLLQMGIAIMSLSKSGFLDHTGGAGKGCCSSKILLYFISF